MNKYFDLTLEELDALADDYHRLHLSNGGSSEFDMSINDISRARIEAFRRKHGQCFLGSVNINGCDRSNPIVEFAPYVGQKIYNFQYTIVLPYEDEKLRALLKYHNTDRKISGCTDIMGSINVIFERLYAIGGIALTWV